VKLHISCKPQNTKDGELCVAWDISLRFLKYKVSGCPKTGCSFRRESSKDRTVSARLLKCVINVLSRELVTKDWARIGNWIY
jgi:hypothetical protein